MGKVKSIDDQDKLVRVLSHANVVDAKHEYLDFTGRWEKLVGKPEMGSNWLIWGLSGSGKTRLMMEGAKYLTGFGKVLINPLETGNSGAFQRSYKQVNFDDVRTRIQVSDREPMDIIRKRLHMRGGADILLVDSLPYTRWKSHQYYDFCAEFHDRMLIFNAHAAGKEPKGKLSEDARYHADIKIRVEGFKAFSLSRYADDTTPMVIYEKKAREYWGLDYD